MTGNILSNPRDLITMTFCIQGPIPSEIFNILFITIPACPSPISVKREVILPLTPVTLWGSPLSYLVPGWRVVPGFLFGHQAHLPHPETPRNQLSSPTPVLCRVFDPWERAEADSDRGAKRMTDQKHICTRGASVVGHNPDFFFTFLTEKEETQIRATFFLGAVWVGDTWLLLHREPGSAWPSGLTLSRGPVFLPLKAGHWERSVVVPTVSGFVEK